MSLEGRNACCTLRGEASLIKFKSRDCGGATRRQKSICSLEKGGAKWRAIGHTCAFQQMLPETAVAEVPDIHTWRLWSSQSDWYPSVWKCCREILCLVARKFKDVGSACGLTFPSVIWGTILNPGHDGLMHHIMNSLSSGMSHSSRCRMCDPSVFSYFVHSAFRQIDAIYSREWWQKCKVLQSAGQIEVCVNMLKGTGTWWEGFDTSCCHSALHTLL